MTAEHAHADEVARVEGILRKHIRLECDSWECVTRLIGFSEAAVEIVSVLGRDWSASASRTGSRPTDQAPSGLAPLGFDPSRWQPLNTAPLDTVVLLYVDDLGKRDITIGRVHYRQSSDVYVARAAGYHGDWNITLWHPLPPAPGIAARSDGTRSGPAEGKSPVAAGEAPETPPPSRDQRNREAGSDG